MRLGTRLLLPLIPTVAVIMAGYTAWSLTERERTLIPAEHEEVRTYSATFGLAFDLALREADRADLQDLANQITRSPSIHGVLLYDSAGTTLIRSDTLGPDSGAPPEVVRQVLESGQGQTLDRTIDGQPVRSLLRALRGKDGRVNGVLEVAEALSVVEQQMASVRRRFFLNTVTLVAALTVLTLWLVRRVVTRPVRKLLTAARTIGQGNLAHRIPIDRAGDELTELATELNGMAENLDRTRAELLREADGRVALERRLLDAERMAAIGNLAAGLAHEIAAPLTVISGRAELLLRSDTDGAARERNVGIIVRQIDRITLIVRNLLDFAKRKQPRFVPVDVVEAVDGVVEFLDREFARAAVTVRRDVPATLPVIADPDLLHQVLVNLILNAIQAMEVIDGPRALTIRIAPIPAEGNPDEIATVAIEIIDNGPGMPPEILASLFQPFFTTKPKGTGLGLVLARRLVEEHGGRLEAESSEAGAIFRILLPVTQPATAETASV